MSDKFTGNWLVTEYVHNPNGQFLGIVHQKRRVQQLENAIRVIQDCEVSPELANHPMNTFAGHWEFDIRREGRLRHYLGADVVGLGLGWGDNCITGQGIWPRFGHNFKSFSLILSPERQLTGGTFFNANEPIAVIIGVACPERADALEAWPSLNLAAPMPEFLQGKTTRYNPEGQVLAECDYQPMQASISKSFSCYQERFYYSPDVISESQIIHDDATIVEIRRNYENGLLKNLELSWAHSLSE